MIKKILLVTLIGMLCIDTFAVELSDLATDERRRIYITVGSGYTVSEMQGPFVDIGAEVRLLGKIYVRVLLDYIFSSDLPKGGEIIHYAYGVNLYAVYKIRLSDLLDFYIDVGGHYTTMKTTASAFGVTFTTIDSNRGVGGGGGFDFQLGNRLVFYLGGTLKLLLSDTSKYWIKLQTGLRYRVR
jgi:hypothetical protein